MSYVSDKIEVSTAFRFRVRFSHGQMQHFVALMTGRQLIVTPARRCTPRTVKKSAANLPFTV